MRIIEKIKKELLNMQFKGGISNNANIIIKDNQIFIKGKEIYGLEAIIIQEICRTNSFRAIPHINKNNYTIQLKPIL